ncbi:hypothetical protein R3P38DRAFT_2793019 [Favolaschia claudopus]|uniref:Uncharacterized protein n=1 Tax=Favolaschia claudopus TaxID=2862362 RepID=A0AAW0AD53_9AGAR
MAKSLGKITKLNWGQIWSTESLLLLKKEVISALNILQGSSTIFNSAFISKLGRITNQVEPVGLGMIIQQFRLISKTPEKAGTFPESFCAGDKFFEVSHWISAKNELRFSFQGVTGHRAGELKEIVQ